VKRTCLLAAAGVLSLAGGMLGLTAVPTIAADAAPAHAAPAHAAPALAAPAHAAPARAGIAGAAADAWIGVLAAPEVPAAASDCPYFQVCGWTGNNYTGTMGALLQNNTSLPPIPWHEINSVYNNGAPCTIYTAGNVWIYRGTNYDSDGGHVAEIHPGTGFPDMQKELPGLWHHVYSNHWCSAG
jgi:Peptidase inhibitor family I36